MTVSLCCEAVTKLKKAILCRLDEAESNSVPFYLISSVAILHDINVLVM